METITTYGVGPDQPTYAQLREQNRVLDGALRLVLESWVNGRKVRDGIGQEVLVTVEAALTATSQEGQG